MTELSATSGHAVYDLYWDNMPISVNTHDYDRLIGRLKVIKEMHPDQRYKLAKPLNFN